MQFKLKFNECVLSRAAQFDGQRGRVPAEWAWPPACTSWPSTNVTKISNHYSHSESAEVLINFALLSRQLASTRRLETRPILSSSSFSFLLLAPPFPSHPLVSSPLSCFSFRISSTSAFMYFITVYLFITFIFTCPLCLSDS